MNRQSLSDWFPVVLKYVGLFTAFVFTPTFWAVTVLVTGQGRLEPLILGAGLTAAGVGEGADAMRQLAAARQPPPPQGEGAGEG